MHGQIMKNFGINTDLRTDSILIPTLTSCWLISQMSEKQYVNLAEKTGKNNKWMNHCYPV